MTSIKWLLLLGTAAAAACTSDSAVPRRDRKSTRLNSSHGYISYAVFCLKKKKKTTPTSGTRRNTAQKYIHIAYYFSQSKQKSESESRELQRERQYSVCRTAHCVHCSMYI